MRRRLEFYEEIGVPRAKLHILDVPDGERAHYSKKTYDIEYEFPFGIQELEGVAYRTDYDIGKHQEHSGKTWSISILRLKKDTFLTLLSPLPAVTALS